MRAEPELIARCRDGDSNAWDELFDQYYNVVARFVFQLSPQFSHEDTEEICQETFLAVVKGIASFRGESAFQTWLLRVAANKAMDYRDKSTASRRGGGSIHLSLQSSGEERPIEPPSHNPGPDALAVNAEDAQLLRQSLDALDESCREIIELRYYGDLSYEEIGAALNLNPKTVSSRLSRCLDRLAEIAGKFLPREDRFAV